MPFIDSNVVVAASISFVAWPIVLSSSLLPSPVIIDPSSKYNVLRPGVIWMNLSPNMPSLSMVKAESVGIFTSLSMSIVTVTPLSVTIMEATLPTFTPENRTVLPSFKPVTD